MLILSKLVTDGNCEKLCAVVERCLSTTLPCTLPATVPAIRRMSRLPVAAIETRQFHIRAQHSRCRQRGVLIEERGAGSPQASLELQWTPADSTQEHEFYRKRAIGFMAKRALGARGRTLRGRAHGACG